MSQPPRESWQSAAFVAGVIVIALAAAAWHFHDRWQHGQEMYRYGWDDRGSKE